MMMMMMMMMTTMETNDCLIGSASFPVFALHLLALPLLPTPTLLTKRFVVRGLLVPSKRYVRWLCLVPYLRLRFRLQLLRSPAPEGKIHEVASRKLQPRLY